MRILVTGANGYLGRGVVKQLVNDGYDVIATDLNDDTIDNRATIKKADIFSLEDPFSYFEKPDILLHMAWRDGFSHNSNSHIDDLPKHFKFISSMVEQGVKKVCVLGSMHEIGFFEGSVNQGTPTNPESLYGISKNALRKMVELLCQKNNVKYQWLRGFYIVGNSEKGSSIFAKIVQAEHEGKTTFPFTSGKNQYDFVNYDEFCEQVAAIVEQDNVLGIINCCSGHPVPLATRVENFILENNFKIKLAYGTFPDRPYDSKAIWGNNDKITQIMKERKNDKKSSIK